MEPDSRPGAAAEEAFLRRLEAEAANRRLNNGLVVCGALGVVAVLASALIQTVLVRRDEPFGNIATFLSALITPIGVTGAFLVAAAIAGALLLPRYRRPGAP